MALFTNQASLTYSGQTVLSNIAAGELLDALSVSKTAGVDAYRVGSMIPYVINLKNAGDAPLTDLTVTDDLGAFVWEGAPLQPLTYREGSLRLFIDGVLQAAPTVTTTPALTVTPITIPAGGVATILYTAIVGEFASPEQGGEITNTATVTGTASDPVSASVTLPAAVSAVLTMQKGVTPTVARQNDALTYTFLIENTGSAPADAAAEVVVEDTFRLLLNDLFVTLDGTPLEIGVQYSYDQNTGLFQTTPGAITVPAAAFTQDPATGAWTTTPGSTLLTVSGTV